MPSFLLFNTAITLPYFFTLQTVNAGTEKCLPWVRSNQLSAQHVSRTAIKDPLMHWDTF